MRAFVTGGTGFIGSRVVKLLVERGDEVVALVRNPDKAAALTELGVTLVKGDLADTEAIRSGAEGADGVFHLAAVYAIGLPESRRQEIIDSAVEGTARVLDAAAAAGVKRTLYVSTVNVFGNTRGQIVDETYQRDLSEGFISAYDEAKYRAHEVAEERIAAGQPIVVVQPAAVYGPGDHSEVGNMIDQTRKGRLPAIPFAASGASLIHVDDVAKGIIAAYDKGRTGESYLLAGDAVTIRDLVQRTARIAGRRVPRVPLPTVFMKLSAPLGPVIGPVMGFPPNFNELITAFDGVTYWATDAKAQTELGFETRPLDEGLRHTIENSR